MLLPIRKRGISTTRLSLLVASDRHGFTPAKTVARKSARSGRCFLASTAVVIFAPCLTAGQKTGLWPRRPSASFRKAENRARHQETLAVQCALHEDATGPPDPPFAKRTRCGHRLHG